MSSAGFPRPDPKAPPESGDAPRETVTPTPDPEALFFGDPFALASADDPRGAGPPDAGAVLGLDAVEEAFFRASEFPDGLPPNSPEAAEPPRPGTPIPLREAPWSQDATTRPGLGGPTPKAVTAKASAKAAPRSAGAAGKASRKPAKTRPKRSAAALEAPRQPTPPTGESGLEAQLEAAGDITDRDLQPPTFTGESPTEIPLRPLFLSQAISVFHLQWVKPVATWDERLQRRFKLFAKVVFGAALLCFGYFADVLELRSPKTNGGASATTGAATTQAATTQPATTEAATGNAAKGDSGQTSEARGAERAPLPVGDGTPEVNDQRGVAPGPAEQAPRAAAGAGEPALPQGPAAVQAQGVPNFEAALALRPATARPRRADPHNSRAGSAAPASAAAPPGVIAPGEAPAPPGGSAPASTGPVAEAPAAMPGLNPPPAFVPTPAAPSRRIDIIRESGALPPPPGGPIPIEEP